MRRHAILVFAGLVGGLLAGCGALAPEKGEPDPPWKEGASVEVITAAPDAGGPLSFRNCPTLAEAQAAVPSLVTGPDANAVPYKTMILQCSWDVAVLDVQGRPAGIGILVFDASAEGVHLWDTARTDSTFPNATDIPDLAEVAFGTGTSGFDELWVVQGDFGFHMPHTRRGGFPPDQMVALARAMLVGLERPPR